MAHTFALDPRAAQGQHPGHLYPAGLDSGRSWKTLEPGDIFFRGDGGEKARNEKEEND